MSKYKIEELPGVSHKDVKPLYSKEEILDKLASAVHFGREYKTTGEQKIEIELMYSIMKALSE